MKTEKLTHLNIRSAIEEMKRDVSAILIDEKKAIGKRVRRAFQSQTKRERVNL
jgi:hypothetical protein